MASKQANYLGLDGSDGSAIVYGSTTHPSPEFTYSDPQGHTRTFGAEEISLRDTDLGQEATIVLRAVADQDRTTLTLLLPPFGLEEHGPAPVATLGVLTTHTGSIGGPSTGQQATYVAVRYAGDALFVER